jgi:hypothetical protein
VGTKWVPRAVVPSRYPRPDLPVGLDAGIGPTARPRPIAVADSPIEAATPDPQHPLCYLYYSSHGGLRVTSHHRGSSTRASCRTVPSAWADGPMPASGAPHVRCPLPSPIRPSKRPLPIHSTRCATCHGATGSKLHHSSTPGQLPDRPVGLGRRADTRIGPTARPRPIAVADSPIEAATPDPQHPLCLLLVHWYRPP